VKDHLIVLSRCAFAEDELNASTTISNNTGREGIQYANGSFQALGRICGPGSLSEGVYGHHGTIKMSQIK